MKDQTINPKSLVFHTRYENGWKDRLNNIPLSQYSSRSYRTGWLDCDELTDEQRQLRKKDCRMLN